MLVVVDLVSGEDLTCVGFADALHRALRKHLPVHLRRARSAALAALAALAAELPAAVLAQLLDLNINTAIAWANYAQHDWTAYLAARTRPSNDNPAAISASH